MWVIDSFDDIYGLNRQWSDYVLEPDATTLTNIVDPLTYGNADIKLNPQQLFTTEFKNGILNETDTEFINALSASDNYDWTPRYPITLYYGTADDYVFPINSETTYEKLLNNGATVTLVPLPDKDHETAVIPYFLSVFELFESLK